VVVVVVVVVVVGLFWPAVNQPPRDGCLLYLDMKYSFM